MLFQVRATLRETSYQTALLEQIRTYNPTWVEIVAGPDDLIDPNGPVALSNLSINSYQLRLVNAVSFVDGRQLFPVPVNTDEPEQEKDVADPGQPERSGADAAG
jgi:hypothetical protein